MFYIDYCVAFCCTMFKKYLASQKYHRSNNIKFVNPLLKIAHFLAFFPINEFDGISKVYPSLYLIYVFIFATTVFIFSHVTSYAAILTLKEDKITITNCISIFSQICFTVFNFFERLNSIFFNSLNYYDLLNILSMIDSKIQTTVKSNFNFIIIDISIGFFTLIILSIYNFFGTYYDQIIFCYATLYIHFYSWSVIMLVMLNLVLSIKYRLVIVNEMLLGENSDYFIVSQKEIWRKFNVLNINHFREIRDLFLSLCDSITLINTIFGWVFVLFYIVCLVNLISSFAETIEYGFTNKARSIDGLLWTGVTLVRKNTQNNASNPYLIIHCTINYTV